MAETALIPALVLFGYLCGSIPFGLILTRLAGMGDIRAIGSGNIGATNVLRTGSKVLAVATLLLDGAKGAVAIGLYSALFTPEIFPELLIGASAVAGHVFPIWLRFRGGKGVATALGVFLAAVPFAGIAACAAWLAVAFAFRYSSAAALAAMAIAPFFAFFVYGTLPALMCLVIAALVWWRHTTNIRRLLSGQEPKIEQKP